MGATLTMPREALTAMLVNPASLQAAVQDGTVTIDGDAGVLLRLFGLLSPPTPNFAVIEP